MKRFLYVFFITACAVVSITSCEKPDAENSDTSVLILDHLEDAVVSSLTEDSYKLSATFTGRGYTLTLTIGNEDLDLVSGNYLVKKEVSAIGDCSVILNDGRSDLPIRSGLVTISTINENYCVELSLSSALDYKFRYVGQISYSVDFEPSESTFFVMESNVTKMNSYWQTVVVDGVMKYAITVLDKDGNDQAYIELISTKGKTLSELVGTYDIKGSATHAGEAIAGAVNWGSGSGSYLVSDSGINRYITNGKITLSSLKGKDGRDYYSITGNGLKTASQSGNVTICDLRIRHVAEKPLLGKVERDQIIASSHMERQMKYSIYLPEGYDGVKEFPVLWLLHGYGDDQNSWLDKGQLARYADAYERAGGREMIIVTPDGLTDFYMGAYENYFFKELMPEVESKFKVKKGREYRTVAGLSMGGHGSLYYGLKYNDMFCYAYAMSPACMFNIQQVIAGKDKADLPGITIETGIQDQTTNLQSVENIHTTLLNEGVTHDYITRDGGHDWTFWQTSLPKVLKKSGEVFVE